MFDGRSRYYNKCFLIDFLFIMQIGNAVINDETDEQGMVDYLGSHAIISDQDVYQIHKYCDFSPNATTQSRECEASYGVWSSRR